MAARIRVLNCFLIFLPFLGRLEAAAVDASDLRQANNIMLAETPECKNDIVSICSKFTIKKNNFAVLDCLQSDVELENRVSEPCQNLLWQYKLNLTRDDRFESAGSSMCKDVLEKFPECKNLGLGSGQRIPCLLDYMENVTDTNCHQFLVKMAKIVFSDFHMIYKFADTCREDINKLQCGRLDNEQKQAQKLHNQGKTLVCLAENISELSKTCKSQVLRVAELQSDDYHLDRPLFFACRDARENFCKDVHAGNGKVYKCLFKHKNDQAMPNDCRKLLTMRQKLIAEDVKVEKTFFSACKEDMEAHNCLAKGPTFSGSALRSTILLCLEDVVAKDQKLKGECIAEMRELRRSLMEDYQITPEIVCRCDKEINTMCGKGLERGGKTLHCLMSHVDQNPNLRPKGPKALPFSDECRGALETLLQEANIGEDFTVDRVLAEACQPVLENECQNSGKSGVINCLMEKVESDHMTDNCEDRLLEIQYFIVRDFKLDTELYKQCHKDAVTFCNAPSDWYVNKPTVDNSPMVFPCLYRHMKDKKNELSSRCEQQIKKTMRKRAKRIDLEPEIEEACIADLGAFCSDRQKYGKGMDMACLQDNYESLSEDCQDAVKEFTEDEDEDLDLDTVLMKACTPMIKKFCGELLEHDSSAADVMDCLIQFKSHHEMNTQCAAGVEHHQVIQMKDFSFTHAFKDACKKDVERYCRDQTKKMEIVVCLSQVVRDDILKEADEPKVALACRKQLRVEVTRRGESIKLDSDLRNSCQADIKNFCSGKHPGNAEVIQCLKFHQKTLSKPCHSLLFKRQQDESALGADFVLMRDCKSMIKAYCSHRVTIDLIGCLRRNMERDKSFDTTCKAVIMKRVLEQAHDYRLNPSLMKSCKLDIPKFCREVVGAQGANQDEELEGKVINCLKRQYIQKRLSRDCHSEIKVILEDGHKDINMDPVLMHACQTQIKQYCSKEVAQHEEDDNKLEFVPYDTGDKVEECLQEKMMTGKIDQASPCGREITRLVEEASLDIHVDPLLNTACLQDLTKWCQEVDVGEGKKMSCLLSVLEEFPKKMKSECRQLLEKRKNLWEYAAKAAPPESFQELHDQIMQSSAKSYLLGVLMTIIGVIFLVGLTCGRVTKRAKFHKDK